MSAVVFSRLTSDKPCWRGADVELFGGGGSCRLLRPTLLRLPLLGECHTAGCHAPWAGVERGLPFWSPPPQRTRRAPGRCALRPPLPPDSRAHYPQPRFGRFSEATQIAHTRAIPREPPPCSGSRRVDRRAFGLVLSHRRL
ncbi:uncharacterized protein LY79DRAFT_17705 [Colletotrichum navitas]|uniref:Uncharacterized protein n=1 Tax=Colletotrichum navitas TaxID=681940 RepID=A0AAD8VDA5_9PEZI|nr:uncharacterized protein LY79DRAFT_17705 [Colletotrichum navitas]KAK1600395.1 hypothetical protein LY79DRAFT_17705 [Colletotrichum navitas]